MSFERAKAYLVQRGLGDRVMEFTVSSATVELAAQAAGVIPARIAKSLSFSVGDDCALVVAAGDAKIDNTKFKTCFHVKAKMLSPDDALRTTGYAVGGVCPFALPGDVPVYLDVSLKRFDRVYPACGSASSAVALTCDELFSCSNAAAWVDVCKGWESDV